MNEEKRKKLEELTGAAHWARERFGMLAMMNRAIEPGTRKQQAIARAEIFKADRLLMAELEG